MARKALEREALILQFVQDNVCAKNYFISPVFMVDSFDIPDKLPTDHHERFGLAMRYPTVKQDLKELPKQELNILASLSLCLWELHFLGITYKEISDTTINRDGNNICLSNFRSSSCRSVDEMQQTFIPDQLTAKQTECDISELFQWVQKVCFTVPFLTLIYFCVVVGE
jgi:hypothetical protein